MKDCKKLQKKTETFKSHEEGKKVTNLFTKNVNIPTRQMS